MLPSRRGSSYSHQFAYRQRCRLHRAAAFLSGRSFPAQPGPPALRRKQMKHIILSFFLIVLAGSARLEAHAFLEDAEPGVGSTVRTSPNEVRIRFTENIEPAFSSIEVFDPSRKEVYSPKSTLNPPPPPTP